MALPSRALIFQKNYQNIKYFNKFEFFDKKLFKFLRPHNFKIFNNQKRKSMFFELRYV